METFKLTKTDWGKLGRLNLTDGSIGNGFANTTKNFDSSIICSSSYPTYIKLEGPKYVFKVQYFSGCFYPIWQKVLKAEPNYLVDKKGNINRIK